MNLRGSNLTITNAEVEKKFEKLSSGKFQLIKTQFEETYDALLNAITHVNPIQSSCDYYSPDILQEKFLENYRSAIKQADLKSPLSYIQDDFKKDHDSALRDIDKKHESIKEKIKTKLRVTKEMPDVIEQLQSGLEYKCEALKSDLILALQHAAEECRHLLIERKEWATKYPEFIDKFGCVVSVMGTLQPLELDKTKGYGLNFGRARRQDHNLLTLQAVSSIKKMSLTEMEAMINQVLKECRGQDDFLKIIKKHMDPLESKHADILTLEEESSYLFFHVLKSVSLKKEIAIIDQEIDAVKKSYADTEAKDDKEIVQQMDEMLKPLTTSAETYKKNIDKTIGIIDSEAKKTQENLYQASFADFLGTQDDVLWMQRVNNEAEACSTSFAMATLRMQHTYQDAIKHAKEMDKDGFARDIQSANECLTSANAALENLNAKLATLNEQKEIIHRKLNMAKQAYNGSGYHNLEIEYKKEVNKLERIKQGHEEMLKKYDHAKTLPDAIVKYGELNFDYTEATSNIEMLSQSVNSMRSITHSLKIQFDKLIEDVKATKRININDCSPALTEAEQLSKACSETIATINKFKDKAILSLCDARKAFSPETHKEHQETFDSLVARAAEVQKQYNSEEKNLSTAQLLPAAMKDYSSMVLNTVKAKEKCDAVMSSCRQLSSNAINIAQVMDEVIVFSKQGIVHPHAEVAVKAKLNEVVRIRNVALSVLIEAKQFMQTAEKALNEAKEKYVPDLHRKPQELFDAASREYAAVQANYDVTCSLCNNVSEETTLLKKHLEKAEQKRHTKQVSTEMRQLILNAILSNLSLWKPKWIGGIDYRYAGVTYKIPHGVDELIKAVMSSTDPAKWMQKVVDVSRTRDSLSNSCKYHFFHLRNEKTTGKLYRALTNLQYDEKPLESLRQALADIPGLKLAEVVQHEVPSDDIPPPPSFT